MASRIRYPLLWAAFLLFLVGGAALVSSKDGLRQALGIVLLIVPLLALGLLSLVYYVRQRRTA